jgi:hypothetical protein
LAIESREQKSLDSKEYFDLRIIWNMYSDEIVEQKDKNISNAG